MAKKKINVGMLGCGFMGRAHSNAYLQMNHFFCAGISARTEGLLRARTGSAETRGFRCQVGLRIDRNRLAEGDRAERHRPDRRLYPEHDAP